MLALTRQPGQKLKIGDDIAVEVVWVRGDKVRLAITAPLDIQILREEAKNRTPREDRHAQ